MNTAASKTYSHESNFTLKVMGYLAFAFLIAGIGSYLAPLFIPIEFFAGNGTWAIYIAAMALAWTSHRWAQFPRPMNFVVYSLFALIIGVMFYPLLFVSLQTGGTEIVAKAFGITGLLSVAAGVYGSTTSKDLSGFRGFFSVAIMGLIIVSIINAIWYSGIIALIVSGIGVVVFSGFIAYQFQMIKHYPADRAMEAGIGLFITLFNLLTSVLQLLMGGRD